MNVGLVNSAECVRGKLGCTEERALPVAKYVAGNLHVRQGHEG